MSIEQGQPNSEKKEIQDICQSLVGLTRNLFKAAFESGQDSVYFIFKPNRKKKVECVIRGFFTEKKDDPDNGEIHPTVIIITASRHIEYLIYKLSWDENNWPIIEDIELQANKKAKMPLTEFMTKMSLYLTMPTV